MKLEWKWYTYYEPKNGKKEHCAQFSRSFVQNNSFIFRALKVPVDIVEKCKQTAAALFLSSFFEEKAREILNLSDLKKNIILPLNNIDWPYPPFSKYILWMISVILEANLNKSMRTKIQTWKIELLEKWHFYNDYQIVKKIVFHSTRKPSPFL